MDLEETGFSTRAIHAGQDPSQWTHRAVVPPICPATTYEQFSPGRHAGYEYSRSGNPTRACLEACIASLEKAKYGLCFSSGLAATTTLAHLLKSGDNILCIDDVYGGTNRYFRTCASNLGIETSFVNALDLELFEKSIRNNTRMVWMETPTNPTMKMVDIAMISEIVKKHEDITFVVDNTFMSPFFQKPLLFGADIAMHSVSKYINGHSDVIMGALALNDEMLYKKLKYLQNSLGAIPSPFDCFLVNRGIKTLSIRMERHQENGLAVAHFLDNHPMVGLVIYPGLPSHPQHELAKRQCSGFSGMISFYIEGGIDTSIRFIKNLNYFTLAESLGSVESLIEVPSMMTHSSVPAAQREILGITDNLIRISVGIESKEDLINDLKQALDGLKN